MTAVPPDHGSGKATAMALAMAVAPMMSTALAVSTGPT